MINLTNQAPLPAPAQSYGLTPRDATANLSASMPETALSRLRTLQNKNGAGYAPIKEHGFFIAYRKGAALIRALTSLVMVGYFRGAASVFAAFEPLNLSHRPRFRTLVGGYSIFKTGITMSQSIHTQKPTNAVSLFSVYLHRQCIRMGIAGALAIRIKRRNLSTVVKFQGWEV